MIEAPVNGGRNYNGPKVEIAALVKSGYMLETPRILQYSSVTSNKQHRCKYLVVTNCEVRTISRKDWSPKTRILRDYTPDIN